MQPFSLSKVLKRIKYNIAQLFFILAPQIFIVLEWARGVGKSTIIGKRIVDCVQQMPRSTGALVGETFAQIKTRTLPSSIAGMEMHGFYMGVHYVVGERPPAHWPQPYEPPLDYKNAICFYNGTVILMISQDGSASSGRGLNVDWVIADEAARLDEEKFQTDVLATNRGNLHRIAEYPDRSWRKFKDCPLHHSVLLCTSTPITIKGQWILKYEELSILHPEKYAFLKANSYVNRENLGEDYFTTNKESMPKHLYDAEILNKRMKRITDGFYPNLNEDIHCYNKFNVEYYKDLSLNQSPTCMGDADLDPTLPLIIGLDWGANINSMVVCQHQQSINEMRALKNFFVLNSTIDDLVVNQFVPYYAEHPTRELHVWYDPSGDAKLANSRQSYAQQLQSKLIEHGWVVTLHTIYYNERHERKYMMWNNILAETDGNYPRMRMNRTNCNETFVSMSHAKAKRGLKEAIKKDKGSERSKSTPQQFATHLSDVMDIIFVGMFLRLTTSTTAMPPPIIR